MKDKKSNRGGARENCGRKPKNAAKVMLAVRVERKTYDTIKDSAIELGVSQGEVVDRLTDFAEN